MKFKLYMCWGGLLDINAILSLHVSSHAENRFAESRDWSMSYWSRNFLRQSSRFSILRKRNSKGCSETAHEFERWLGRYLQAKGVKVSVLEAEVLYMTCHSWLRYRCCHGDESGIWVRNWGIVDGGWGPKDDLCYGKERRQRLQVCR